MASDTRTAWERLRDGDGTPEEVAAARVLGALDESGALNDDGRASLAAETARRKPAQEWELQYLLDWLQIAETGNEEDDLMPNLVVSMIYLDFCVFPDRGGLTLTPEGRVLRDLLEKGAEAWRVAQSAQEVPE